MATTCAVKVRKYATHRSITKQVLALCLLLLPAVPLSFAQVATLDTSNMSLTVPSVAVGPDVYVDVRLTSAGDLRFALAAAYRESPPVTRPFAVYSPESRQLSIPSVLVGETLYKDVLLKGDQNFVFDVTSFSGTQSATLVPAANRAYEIWTADGRNSDYSFTLGTSLNLLARKVSTVAAQNVLRVRGGTFNADAMAVYDLRSRHLFVTDGDIAIGKGELIHVDLAAERAHQPPRVLASDVHIRPKLIAQSLSGDETIIQYTSMKVELNSMGFLVGITDVKWIYISKDASPIVVGGKSDSTIAFTDDFHSGRISRVFQSAGGVLASTDANGQDLRVYPTVMAPKFEFLGGGPVLNFPEGFFYYTGGNLLRFDHTKGDSAVVYSGVSPVDFRPPLIDDRGFSMQVNTPAGRKLIRCRAASSSPCNETAVPNTGRFSELQAQTRNFIVLGDLNARSSISIFQKSNLEKSTTNLNDPNAASITWAPSIDFSNGTGEQIFYYKVDTRATVHLGALNLTNLSRNEFPGAHHIYRRSPDRLPIHFVGLPDHMQPAAAILVSPQEAPHDYGTGLMQLAWLEADTGKLGIRMGQMPVGPVLGRKGPYKFGSGLAAELLPPYPIVVGRSGSLGVTQFHPQIVQRTDAYTFSSEPNSITRLTNFVDQPY